MKLTQQESLSQFCTDLQLFLSGRSLLETEIPFPKTAIHDHIKHGYIATTPGLVLQAKKWRCQRCTNETQRLFATFPCANCQHDCYYCRKCIMMGRVSSCTPLLSWKGPSPDKTHNKNSTSLNWEGELSSGQQVASKAAIKAVQSKSSLLIWAVCGAGKTEVLFAAIDTALQAGDRVCIATPRTDVVLELAPRFKNVFPTIPVAALYGGSEDRHMYAPLTISTTHQLLRFEQAFDVVIVDEVDAFPYTFDASLKWAVEKSAKQNASQLFLTATPSAAWQLECKYGKRPHVKIPARYHRKPLPVPTFKWCGNWRKQLEKGKIPPIIEKWVKERIEQGKQALLFLPTIELMEKSLPLFQKIHPQITAVHSEDPLRKEKVENMRNKTIPFLLTTTILERGVTFPNIDVAVLGAEDDIFTESALVQIAGRVGRHVQFPTGNITFFHYGRSHAMIRALIHIDQMNGEAKKERLID